MKKIFLLIATLGVLLSSCLKDEAYIAVPTIANIRVTPSTVEPGAAAKAYAKITNAAYIVDKSEIAVSSATLFYKVGEGSETSVTMTASGDIFSAEIPASVNSALGVEVFYRIEASNDRNQTAKSAILKYTVGVAQTDYSKLKLNEISGVGADGEKFYELINTGTEDISLEGCQIFYNGNAGVGLAPPVGDGALTWTGADDQTIAAGKLLTLLGRNNPGSFTTGLTAARSIRITFRDPAGNIIDEFLRPSDTGIYEITDKSFSRLPDGSGLFYFTNPTPNATNGNSAEGLMAVPGQGAPEPEQPTDYTRLKLNEISGVGADGEKFYELINIGIANINLEGCKIYYNANGSTGMDIPTGDGTLTWTGAADQAIEAGKLFTLLGRGNPGSFTAGLTAGRSVRITLKDPDNNIIDEFVRAEDTGDYTISDKSYSRIVDGTGAFYFTTPTPNAMNGTSIEGLTLVPNIKIPSVDYSKLKLNEISGVGADGEKFYELINTGTEDITLEGCQLFYNGNASTGLATPTADGSLTWTGTATQTIEAGKLFVLLGRNSPGSFTTGLTAGRKIKITFKDPAGNIIDEFTRSEDTGAYEIGDKSFSRVPDGTGPFYFTTPTPNATNGSSTTGLTALP